MKLPVDYTKLAVAEKRVVRLAYIEQQKGKCYHCKGDLNEQPPAEILAKKIKPHLYPDGFFTHPVHLHHNHDTGMTIGAVHNYCNAVLWEYYGE